MKLHLVTIGSPKLHYAQEGWAEYTKRLRRFHQMRVSHIADKHNDAASILAAAGSAYKIALVIDGPQLSSEELAAFLEKRSSLGQELCFMIGGPEGLPEAVITASDMQLSFSKLTFPHDLAMVVLAETLYRSSSINAGIPYHRG